MRNGHSARWLPAVFDHVSQQAIYEDLSGNGVSVHAYGVLDVTPPEVAGGQVHAVGGEIADLWVVVYDSGGEETQKSALLAEEDSVGTFYGFWTYDSAISTASASTSLRRVSGLAGNSHGLEREQLTANVSERNSDRYEISVVIKYLS